MLCLMSHFFSKACSYLQIVEYLQMVLIMCCAIEFYKYDINIRRSEDTRYAQINNELLTLTKS